MILWGIILVLLISVFMLLSNAWEKEKARSQNTNFTLWTLWDKADIFQQYLNDFKQSNTLYKDTNFNVVSFSSYDEYYYALIWALLRWEAPDMFVINNNEGSLFDGSITWIDPSVISPDDFRRRYDLVFQEDLISQSNQEEQTIDYLKWMPLWYQTLGVFYNFRDIKPNNLKTWAYLNDFVQEYRMNSQKSALWIGKWTSVYQVSDIFTQFLLLNGVSELWGTKANEIRSALMTYLRYGEWTQPNRYDEVAEIYQRENKTNLDAFSRWDIQVVFWYPSLLEEISKIGYNKTYLRAWVFPMNSENSWTLLANYNYFVINKDTAYYKTALDLMLYFNSPNGLKKYLELFPYYLPSQFDLLDARLEENLLSWYNIKYKDFYNSALELTSFDKWLQTYYDKEIINVLDSQQNSVNLFDKFQKQVLCIKSKMVWDTSSQQICN